MRVAARHDRPFVARGSGTGLAGGATPVDDPLVIVTTQLNRILEVDAEERVAWVEPGVLNLDLTPRGRPPRAALRARPVVAAGVHDRRQRRDQRRRPALPRVGRHRRPTCSRSRSCSPTARVARARRPRARPARLRPARLLRRQRGHDGHRDPRSRCDCMPDPPAVAHAAARLHVDRGRRRHRQRDHRRRDRARRARDDGRARSRARSRTSSAPATRATPQAVLLVELDGLADGVDRAGRRGARASAASTAPAPCASRPTTPSARCSGRAASRRSARSRGIAPDYYLHDAVVPRTQLVEVLRQVYAIADEQRLTMMNVFHAGDGNLHPLIVFDGREPGVWERVHAAGDEILAACVAAGGVLSGEHGIGLEKRERDAADVHARRSRRAGAAARRVRSRRAAPTRRRSCRSGSRCGELAARPGGRVDLTAVDAPRSTSSREAVARRRRRRRRRRPDAVGGRRTRRARRRRGPRARRRRHVRPRRPHRHRRRRAPPWPSSAAVLGEHGAGVPARPARSDAPPSAACSRPASRASAGCATGRCATACSRCASSPPTATS